MQIMEINRGFVTRLADVWLIVVSDDHCGGCGQFEYFAVDLNPVWLSRSESTRIAEPHSVRRAWKIKNIYIRRFFILFHNPLKERKLAVFRECSLIFKRLKRLEEDTVTSIEHHLKKLKT